jgi:hypothetical protein
LSQHRHLFSPAPFPSFDRLNNVRSISYPFLRSQQDGTESPLVTVPARAHCSYQIKMAAVEPADEPYEQLVRQQLDALGYDSAAIPDDVRALTPPHGASSCSHTRTLFRNRSQVLRAFLKDFDNKMEIQDEASPMEAPGDLPGVASSDQTSVKAFGEPWATEATEEPPVARPASARLQGARRVSTAPSGTRLQGAPAAKRAAPARPVSSSPAGRSRRATLWNVPSLGSATAHRPSLLGWTLQAPGCTPHSSRGALRPLSRRQQPMVLPSACAHVPDAAALCTHPGSRRRRPHGPSRAHRSRPTSPARRAMLATPSSAP